MWLNTHPSMRQKVMPAKFQPHASQMHLKWAEIRYCAQYAVYSNDMYVPDLGNPGHNFFSKNETLYKFFYILNISKIYYKNMKLKVALTF